MYQKCFNHLVSIYVGGGLVIFHRVKNIAINKIVLFLLIFAPVNSGLFLFSNNTCVSAANDYETPILLAGKEDIILYKKDIIISTDDLKNIKTREVVTFDLTKTVNIHSSFIGFLIHAKHHINKNGGRLVLLLSLTVEKILIMLNIIEYFSPEIETSFNKKTA